MRGLDRASFNATLLLNGEGLVIFSSSKDIGIWIRSRWRFGWI